MAARWGGVFKLNVIDENVIEFNDTKWDPWERLLTTNAARNVHSLLHLAVCESARNTI